MEMLYGAGILVAVLVVWQTVRWWRERQRRLRIKLEPVPPGPDVGINIFPELGKVRVRPRRDDDEDELRVAPRVVPVVPPRAPVPGREQAVEVPVAEAAEENVPVLLTPVAEADPEAQHDLFAHEKIAPPPFPKKETAAPTPAQVLYETSVEPVRPVRAESEVRAHVDVQDVIALHVVARQHPFNGEDLLRCILSYGLRYGEMFIFHRHERPTGQGRILFSMAKAVEPGTFDLEAMTGEEIPGVSFFLSLPGVNSIHAYDIMVDTAKRLATELEGEILDEQKQSLTRQLVEHYRERVQEFERRRLMQRPPA